MNEIRDRVKRQLEAILTYREINTMEKVQSILSLKELAVVDRKAELPTLTYEEYMAIHSAWANSKETVENLLRRITLETCHKVHKEGWVKKVWNAK